MKDFTLSISILSWNTCELTKNCIQSIIENTEGMDYEIIIVDNASTDDSVEVIEENFPQVRLVKNSRNLGFAKGSNQALEISHGKYFCALNSDTIIHGDAFKHMVDFLETHPKVGVVTGKLLNPDGSIQYLMHRRFPTFLGLTCGYLYKRYPRFKTKWAREYFMLDNNFDKTEKIDQASTCIMIRKDIIESIGGLFDAERFPLLYNDVDLCYRVYQKGFEIYLVSDAVITHWRGQSIKKLDFSVHMKELIFSCLGFFKKHKKYLDYTLMKIGYFLFFSLIALYSLILLLIRKISFTSFKDRFSLPLSALFERRVDL